MCAWQEKFQSALCIINFDDIAISERGRDFDRQIYFAVNEIPINV